MNFNYSNFQVSNFLPNMNDFTSRLSEYFDADKISQTLIDNQIPLAFAGTFLAGMAFHKAIQYFRQSKEISEEKQIAEAKEWNLADYLPKVNIVFHPFFSSPFNDPFFDIGFYNRHIELFL